MSKVRSKQTTSGRVNAMVKSSRVQSTATRSQSGKRAAERAQYDEMLADFDRRLAEANAQIDAVLMRLK